MLTVLTRPTKEVLQPEPPPDVWRTDSEQIEKNSSVAATATAEGLAEILPASGIRFATGSLTRVCIGAQIFSKSQSRDLIRNSQPCKALRARRP
jgi:hypothetical protein